MKYIVSTTDDQAKLEVSAIPYTPYYAATTSDLDRNQSRRHRSYGEGSAGSIPEK
ncbi:hypothetical protein GCK32_021472, partial [Trichostrongylus colubriformis]